MKNLSRPGGSLSYRRRNLAIALVCTALATRVHAQGHSLPTATRAGDLQIGGGVVLGTSTYNFNQTHLVGAAFYTTFDVRSHWGGEANFHQITSSQDSTVYERTYEIGPRLYALRGPFEPYAKALYGRGDYNFSKNIANIAYNVLTVGGGADLRVTRSFNIRGDYEYQTWPGFPIAALHPSVVTIGVAFHFHE
jgi:hypothetical protein